MELNAALSVADLEIDLDDVDIVTDSSMNIVSITPPAVEEEVVEEELEGEELEGEDSTEEISEESPSEDSDEQPGES